MIRLANVTTHPSKGYVYILAISTGAVKVGYSFSPLKRISTHVKAASTYGATVNAVWVSLQHRHARETESALHTYCRHRASRVFGDETFLGVNFTDVTAAAEEMERQLGLERPRPWFPYRNASFQAYRLERVAEETGLPLSYLADGCRDGRIAHCDIGIRRHMPRMTREQIDWLLTSKHIERLRQQYLPPLIAPTTP